MSALRQEGASGWRGFFNRRGGRCPGPGEGPRAAGHARSRLSRADGERVHHWHAHWGEMAQAARGDRQPVAPRDGGDGEVGEAGRDARRLGRGLQRPAAAASAARPRRRKQAAAGLGLRQEPRPTPPVRARVPTRPRRRGGRRRGRSRQARWRAETPRAGAPPPRLARARLRAAGRGGSALQWTR